MMNLDLTTTLKKHFGYSSFRASQKEIIESVLNKKDILVIMPTGGGKSICYQLPALLLEGITVVISPLIALMKDQVDGLQMNGIQAAYFNSQQTNQEQNKIYNLIAENKLKLIYSAPESLELLYPILAQSKISFVAIDEAHCISSWGHDFRPAYTQLAILKKKFDCPVIALTATADKATRTDILNQLQIPNARLFLNSFNRPNLNLNVQPGQGRFKKICSFLEKYKNKSGIIYCLSRKNTESLAQKLKEKGWNAVAYHAGLNPEKRAQVQNDFISDKMPIICATIAFGMGIDKSNVRWVIHYNLPKNIEGYYQEIGRAGRDGLDADTLLFYSYADVVQLQKFAENSSQKEIQLAKLNRMQEFAEALTCRRKILLSYFGEILEENCGNCDVCKNPPVLFDGTVLAQKFLSTIYRMKEQEPIGVIVDVLRGAQNQKILTEGYQNLKTYGIGKNVSWKDWQQYGIQLVNQGAIEIAFHQNNRLKLNNFSSKILFKKHKITLAENNFKLFKDETKSNKLDTSKKKKSLFEELKAVRLKIAQEEDLPAYLIFSDASLKNMEELNPITDSEFLEVQGVGQAKLEKYGTAFIDCIATFLPKKKRAKKGNTYKKTLELFNIGLTIDEISVKRDLGKSTIVSHLCKLYTENEAVPLQDLISVEDLALIKKAQQKLDYSDKLKTYFDYFEEKISYETIRIGLTFLS